MDEGIQARRDQLVAQLRANGRVRSERVAEAFRTNALAAALTQPGEDVTSGVHVTLDDVWGGLGLWLALQEPDMGWISAIGTAADRGLVPALISFPGLAGTAALLDIQALAALVRLPDDGQPQADAFQLAARPFGRGGSPLAERLVAHLQAWNVNGRPSTADLRITVHLPHTGSIADADIVIQKHHSRLALSWPRFKGEQDIML